MSADFWAGYISGAVGILVGNPLDLIKTRLQAGPGSPSSESLPSSVTNTHVKPNQLVWSKQFEHWTALARGAAAPILGYGALNALLFVSYNRSLALLNTGQIDGSPEGPSALSVWTAGALGGLATFFVSAPTELVKCRAQVSHPPRSSWDVTRELWRHGGLRGLYIGGGITSIRDGVGYGFYFWSYHLSKQALAHEDDTPRIQALKVLLCGGLAGIVTWASIFPFDVIKTRVQTFDLRHGSSSTQSHLPESEALIQRQQEAGGSTTKKPGSIFSRPSTLYIARETYRAEGAAVFFRGLGVCSARAFIVNAIQWAMYEWIMKILTKTP